MMFSTNINKNINRHLIEIKPNRENIRLIYLNNIEPTFDIQSNLLKINPATQFYTNIQLCIDFIKTISNEEIFLIISNILLSNIFDYIYFLQPIIAIFIYDDKQEINELKIKYPKIIDRYTNQNDLLKSIQEKIQFIEKQTFIYSLFDQKHKSIRDLTKESATFLWYHMLINIFKQMPQNESLRDEILNKCSDYYRKNRLELDNIELFRQNYQYQQAIQWYTNESFLYRLLNRALHIIDFEILYSIRFFLIDLYFEIENKYKNIKNQEYLIVYHAQIMSIEEIEKLKKYIGCLISINHFLSTSRNKNLLLSIFQQNFSTYINVLFEIHVNLSNETIILTDISSYNSIYQEKEILFNINSLLKIDSIEYDSINNLWNIKLIANHDETKHINEYLKWIQNETDYHSTMIYFGHLLWNNLGQMTQAKNYFHILLKSLSNNHTDIPKIYIELGHINNEIGEYNSALHNYQCALNIYQKQIPKDNICIISSLNYIGIIYKHMSKIDRAIDYYRQSLDIYETTCSQDQNHIHRSNIMINMGLAYRDKKDFNTALNYLTQAYNIRCDILPNDDLLIANLLIDIGNIYHDKHDLNQVLNYYQQALSIQELVYPNDHLNKAKLIRNIGIIYSDKQDWQNALNYLNRTLKMYQCLLSMNINHPDIAICYGDIGNIYEKMNNLDLALNYYDKQFQIEEQCLSFNHSNLIIHFDKIINILKKKNQIEKAINLCQEKLLILKNIFGIEYESNTRIVRILILIATLYEDKNPRESHQYYQHILEIFEHNKNEDIFQICLSTMINFYWKCRMFDRALICQMKLLNLRRSILSSNHHDIAYSLRDLARLYRVMNKSNEALQYFNQSLRILQTKYGSEHIDVKNIQKEIIDLKDIIKSLSANADDDYNNRRSSNAHKEFFSMPQNDTNSQSSTSIYGIKNKSSTSDSTSVVCVII
ncbi:unnamed protein product [Rotaria sordida]|uniref:Uncharacterized protein n=1 Tax=Rotaria sordida TaxID=392033 RepID=A0A813WPG5_9BILA|nr:unnamed protein product [Rotaria sordida]